MNKNTGDDMNPVVLCENLVKIYQVDDLEVVALQGLDLEIRRGEMMSIIGASGSGKSTLLNILGGLDRPSAGQIRVAGRNLLKAPEKEMEAYRLHDVGFVWQQSSRNLLPYLTAQENIELPMIAAQNHTESPSQRARELLDAVGLLSHSHHHLGQLSGGQQQRIAIAVALANQPQLLLADEPTGEVDSVTAHQIWQLFRDLNERYNLTIVIVSHDRDIAHVVDRVIGIRDGKTSTETVRQTGGRLAPVLAHPTVPKATTAAPGTPATAHHLHLEERVVLDAVGRLQMPQEYLDVQGIRRRAIVQLVDDGILVRPVQDRTGASGDPAQPDSAGASPVAQDPIARRPVALWRRLLGRRSPEADRLPAGGETDVDLWQPIIRQQNADDAKEGGPVVTVSGLQRVYRVGDQPVYALKGIDLAIPRGGFALFRGRSGSGKTTLLNLIGGLDTPTAGSISLFGQDISQLSSDALAELRQTHIGFVFQAFSLVPTLSAQENVEVMLRTLATPARERRQRAAYCLAMVGLSRWADHRPFEMSGGQQQRLSIARALAHGPPLIIADEPTSDLDSGTGRQILDLFTRLVQEEGITVLMASHDSASEEFATVVYELSDGEIAS